MTTIVANGTIILVANGASVGGVGVVQLNDTLTSNSNTLAATANAINALNLLLQAESNLIQSAYNEANSFQSVINTSYATANVSFSAFSEANSFQSVINTAYATANVVFSAYANANAALTEANSFQSVINTSYATANVAFLAYANANAALAEANSFQSVINSAYTTANVSFAAFSEANSFQSVINTAYATANVSFSAFSEANSFQSVINTSYATANVSFSAYNQANNSYATANVSFSAFAESNSFQSIINTSYATANVSFSAFAEANSFQSVINTAYATANVAFSAYANANAALAEANSFQSVINSVYALANSLSGASGIANLRFQASGGLTVNSGSWLYVTTASNTVTLGTNTATISQVGVVQLTDNVLSSSTTTAATPNSVNVALTTAQYAFFEANSFQSVINTSYSTANVAFQHCHRNGLLPILARHLRKPIRFNPSLIPHTLQLTLSSQLMQTQMLPCEANSFQSVINTSYATANVSFSAFKEANSFQSVINTAYATANVAFSAYANANAALAEANSFQSVINSVYTLANSLSGSSGIANLRFQASGGLTVNSGSWLYVTTASNTVTLGTNTATISQVGVVQLTDNVLSSSTTTAATPNSVNVALTTAQYAFFEATNSFQSALDANSFSVINTAYATANVAFSAYANANAALAEANTAVQRAGDVMSGTLTVPNLDANVNVTATNIIANGYLQSAQMQQRTPVVDYILQPTDSGLTIICSNTTQINVNVNSTLSIGFRCLVTSINTGNVAIITGPGVTINPTFVGSNKVSAQYNTVSLYCYQSNTFILDGAIA